MRKALVAFLILVLIFCCFTGSVFAALSEDQESYSLEEYAFMDMKNASDSMREKILEARETIIFSKSWAADGAQLGIFNVETGEIVEWLPSFSSLFPGWDVPVMDTNKEINPNLVVPKYVDMDCDPYIPGWDIIDSDTFVKSTASGKAK